MKIAIIPARGGSKRIPGKNIRDFLGKPMLHWAIEAARDSGLFEHIVVSTDSTEIAAEAVKAGAEVPFMRPAHLADDHAVTRDVINHAIIECTQIYGHFDQCCCIYGTSPFLSAEDLSSALHILQTEEVPFVFSATAYPYPIQRAFFINQDSSLQMFHPEHAKTRSQDLIPAYHDAGMFYWGKSHAFLEKLPMFAGASRPFLIPLHRVCDLDTLDDWERAEWMMKAKLLAANAYA